MNQSQFHQCKTSNSSKFSGFLLFKFLSKIIFSILNFLSSFIFFQTKINSEFNSILFFGVILIIFFSTSFSTTTQANSKSEVERFAQYCCHSILGFQFKNHAKNHLFAVA
jgi:hypothetical protein